MLVRELEIGFWLVCVLACFPVLLARRRSLVGALGAATAMLCRRLGATFIKVGQIASTRPDLFPPEFLVPLVELQDRVPPFDSALARRAIEEEFARPLGDLFAEFSAQPIASASVAQVHRALLREARGPLPAGAVVAIKIRRPGIVRRAYLDEAILRVGARLLSLIPTVGLVSPVESVDHFCEAVNLQLDFRIELAFHANLPFKQLRSGGYFQGVQLLDLRGMKIDASGRVSLPNPQFANGKVLDVQEHVFSASARGFMPYHY